MQRVSVAIACQRFRGIHSYKTIAEMLDYIYAKYGIKITQIIATVTDNGSNFVKAFKEFSLLQKPSEPEKKLNILNINTAGTDSDVDEYSDADGDEDAIELVELSNTSEGDLALETDSTITLPKHIRCASHTLNLIATSDCTKAT